MSKLFKGYIAECSSFDNKVICNPLTSDDIFFEFDISDNDKEKILNSSMSGVYTFAVDRNDFATLLRIGE